MTWLIILGALIAYAAIGLIVARAVATEDDEGEPWFVLALVGLWPLAVGYWTIDAIVFGGLRKRQDKAVELRKARRPVRRDGQDHNRRDRAEHPHRRPRRADPRGRGDRATQPGLTEPTVLRRIEKLVDETDRWAAIPRAVVWSLADLARAVLGRVSYGRTLQVGRPMPEHRPPRCDLAVPSARLATGDPQTEHL